MANYLLDLKKKAKNSRGSTAAKNKLMKTGGTATKTTGGINKSRFGRTSTSTVKPKSKLVGSAAAIKKLKDAAKRKAALNKLKKTAGTAKSNTPSKSKGQGAGGKYTTKAYQKYLDKMKAGQRKSVNQRKSR